jgi:hypothetical protein
MTRAARFSDDFDERGVLRDGRSARVSLQMRDSLRRADAGPIGQREGDLCTRNGWSGTLKLGADGELFCDIGRKDAKPVITDGRTDDRMALHRPGYRINTSDTRQKVADAYAHYETSLVNRYKVGDGEMQCPTCFGSGVLNGEDCDDCDGTGIMPDYDNDTSNGEGGGFGSTNEGPSSDSRNRSVSLDQHRQTMDRLYRERDAADQAAYLNRK